MAGFLCSMNRVVVGVAKVAVLPAMIALAGCAGPIGHQAAFSERTALTGNSSMLELTPAEAMRAAKQVLIRQGFTIDSVDLNAGLIKATRNFQDPKCPEQSYHITASAYVFENSAEGSTVTLSASQQTVLHREWHTWWHLLWIIPIIPTGTEYQTVVTKEGNITDRAFYADFFSMVASVGKDVRLAEKAAAQRAAAEKEAAEKVAAEKLAVEREAAERAAAQKLAAEREAAAKAAALKLAAEKAAMERRAAMKAAEEKAAAERVAAEKAFAEAAAKAAADKLAAERAAAVQRIADRLAAENDAAEVLVDERIPLQQPQ